MKTVTISMPESMKKFIDDQMEEKGFGNVSEYLRALVRQQQQQASDERLETLLLEGLASKKIPMGPDFWKHLREEAKTRVRKQSHS